MEKKIKHVVYTDNQNSTQLFYLLEVLVNDLQCFQVFTISWKRFLVWIKTIIDFSFIKELFWISLSKRAGIYTYLYVNATKVSKTY